MLMNEFEAVHISLIACNDELCPRLIYFLTSLFFALLFQRDSKIDFHSPTFIPPRIQVHFLSVSVQSK